MQFNSVSKIPNDLELILCSFHWISLINFNEHCFYYTVNIPYSSFSIHGTIALPKLTTESDIIIYNNNTTFCPSLIILPSNLLCISCHDSSHVSLHSWMEPSYRRTISMRSFIRFHLVPHANYKLYFNEVFKSKCYAINSTHTYIYINCSKQILRHSYIAWRKYIRPYVIAPNNTTRNYLHNFDWLYLIFFSSLPFFLFIFSDSISTRKIIED